ncbi:YjzC family protein [Halobacillus karajensis]|uniref:YjzC family protein n=1 Tax=Halobacillus karajensis TaxID=195088 RepID=UPI0009457C58|nr:YjzC family protein [Halobacillus karajensis]
MSNLKQVKKPPESGTYKVDSLVNGNTSKSKQSIKLNEGEQFPPSPSDNDAAYWIKTS